MLNSVSTIETMTRPIEKTEKFVTNAVQRNRGGTKTIKMSNNQRRKYCKKHSSTFNEEAMKQIENNNELS